MPTPPELSPWSYASDTQRMRKSPTSSNPSRARSAVLPGSRWAPQFGGKLLRASLADQEIDYLWLGQALGGRRDDPALSTPDGKPDYRKISLLPDFLAAIADLTQRIGEQRTVLLCAEGDPMRCHRKHLVGAALRGQGVGVEHILRDGTVISDDKLEQRDMAPLPLFDTAAHTKETN